LGRAQNQAFEVLHLAL